MPLEQPRLTRRAIRRGATIANGDRVDPPPVPEGTAEPFNLDTFFEEGGTPSSSVTEEQPEQPANTWRGLTRLNFLGLNRTLQRLNPESISALSNHFASNNYDFIDALESIRQLETVPLDILSDIQFNLDRVSPINIDLRAHLYVVHSVNVPNLWNITPSKQVKGDVKLLEDGKIIDAKDAVFIPNLGYFRKDDKRIIKDFITSEQSLILDSKYVKYYTSIYTDIEKDGQLICKDSYSVSKNIFRYLPEVHDLNNGNKYYITEDLLNTTIFKELYIENINEGYFALKSSLSQKDFINFITKHPRKTYRKIKGMFGDFERSIKNIPNTYQNTLGKRYPFGIEIETISGYLPLYLDQKLYYSAVHDGSLRDKDTGDVYGGEYVSDVLWGDLGLQQLKKLCFELTKRCLIDKRCGVHCHLSDVTFSQENIVLMYYIYQTIEDEMFDMLPRSRRNNEYCRRLKRVDIDLNNLLPNNTERNFYIKKYYDDIIAILSQKTHPDEYVNKKKDHPKGFKCGYDHSAARYCWVNFIPAVFNTRKNGVYTIEFRPNPATTSYRKIKNWLLICMAFVDIVENNKQYIYNSKSDINITDILKTVYKENSTKLIEYVEERKALFSQSDLSATQEVMIENKDYQENELDNNFKIKNL